MRPRTLDFATAQGDGLRAPLVVATVTTPAGVRVYCASGMTDLEVWSEPTARADGTIQADGGTIAGAQSLPVISVEARVINYGAMRDTGSILPTIALRGRRSREAGNVEVTLRNDDDHFGKVLAQDVFVSSKLAIAVGFRGLRRDQFITRFQGVIQEQLLTRETFVLRAETA